MSIQTATQVGNPLIRAKAKVVKDPGSPAVRRVIKDLADSMRHHELVGMAAPQIGKSIRVFVSEIRKTKLRKGESVKRIDALRVFINPKIVRQAKRKAKGWEGCGSVGEAGIFAQVARPVSVTVTALGADGKKFTLDATGLLARIIQHEVDHLNGIVFTDKADPRTYMSRGEYLKRGIRK